MTTVTIEYCVPCGLLDRAVSVQRELLERFGRDLDGVALEPGHGGVFRVDVAGETVWDSEVHGSDPDMDLVADAVADHVPGAPVE